MSTLKKEKKIPHPKKKTFHLKELEKEQTKHKVSRRKQIIKIRTEINKM